MQVLAFFPLQRLHFRAISVVAKVTEMVFLGWARPSSHEQKSCIDRYFGIILYDIVIRFVLSRKIGTFSGEIHKT